MTADSVLFMPVFRFNVDFGFTFDDLQYLEQTLILAVSVEHIREEDLVLS